MSVASVYLRDRQAATLGVSLVLLGVLVYFGGDLNLPVPGAPVPIVLGALAPLIAACLWLAGLDSQHLRWAESVAPRRLGRARCGYAMALATISGLLLTLTGSHSVGLPVSIALVRGTAILIGVGAAAWWWGGNSAGYIAIVGVTMAQVVAGGVGAVEGEIWAPWALMFAGPGDVVASWCAVTGVAVAAMSARYGPHR